MDEVPEEEELQPQDQIDHNSNNAQTSPRRLLNKFLAKSYRPPLLLQPKFQLSSSISVDQINLAYRHPTMLLERETNVSEDNINEELEGAGSVTPIESMIVPVRKSSIPILSVPKEGENCRLVGKVNPNIARTWEQLKGSLLNNSNDKINTSMSTSASASSDDKQSYTLFCRKNYNFKELEERLEKYPVRKLRHSESSGDFFDSIDETSITDINNLDLMADYIGETTAGEGLADFDSLDRKIC